MHEDAMADRRAAKLSALLRATDPPAPALGFPAERIARARQRHAAVRWRLAAGIAALLAVAVLVRPVRAWFIDTARTIFARSSAPATTPPAVPPGSAAVSGASPATNAVTFTPRAGTFLVEIAARQAAGTLRLVRADGMSASAALTGDPADAELLVRPAGLRIANRPEATADYTVSVPAGISRLTVRIAREAARDVVLPSDGAMVVPVGAAPRRE